MIAQFVSLLPFAVTLAIEQMPLMVNELSSSFDGQSVLRCRINEQSSMDEFVQYIENSGLDMWTDRLQLGDNIDVRTETDDQKDLLLSLPYGCKVWINDLQDIIDEQNQQQMNADASDFFAKYHPYEELVHHVKDLTEKYPDLARFVPSIGKTWEGRDIAVVHITGNNAKQNKKIVWFDGGIHAREWISSHVSLFLIEQLLTKYGQDEVVTRMLDNIEFVASPHINPDGYEYSRTRNRMWRKNRRRNDGGSFGVDLNRNFDIKWGQGGSSRSPASDTYMGPSASSEPEVKAVAKYIQSLDKAVVGINFHSYGQLILRPYGYGWETHPTEELNKELGDGMRDVIKKFSKTSYTSERSVGLYPVTGGMDDWMTSQGLIGFTIELRDTGRHGFVLPPTLIRPTAEEIWEAMKFLGPFVIDKVESRQ